MEIFAYASAKPMRLTFRSVPIPGFDPMHASLAPLSAARFSLAAISPC